MADKKKPAKKKPAAKPARKRPAPKRPAPKKAAPKKATARKAAPRRAPARKPAAQAGGEKKLTIQDLAAIRDKTMALLTIRQAKGRGKVTVHMGTCGIAAGAREVMDALLDEMRKRNVRDVLVTTSGCVGLCSREPMATVELKGKPPVKYIDLNGAKIRRILVEHVVGGAPVAEYALAVGSETVY